jgi:hypothetical protein
LVGPRHPRPWRAPLQHGELMAQDEDLDVLGGVGADAQQRPAQQLRAYQVDQPEGHRRIMSGQLGRRSGRSTTASTVSGTHNISAAVGSQVSGHRAVQFAAPVVCTTEGQAWQAAVPRCANQTQLWRMPQ